MSKEYIEKERALQLLEEHASDDEVFFAVRAIEVEPPADVKPVVRGEWEGERIMGCDWVVTCSKCGKEPEYFVNGYEMCVTVKPNFCPNCGADMRKETK